MGESSSNWLLTAFFVTLLSLARIAHGFVNLIFFLATFQIFLVNSWPDSNPAGR